MSTARILIIDACPTDREWLRALAVQGVGSSDRIDTASTFETAVAAASGTPYDLVVLTDDLGTGTNAFISVVTLRAAGCTGRILVTGSEVKPQRSRELSRIGIHEYHAKTNLTPGHLLRALHPLAA